MTSNAVILTDLDTVPDSVIQAWLAAMSGSTRDRAGKFRSLRRLRQFVAARELLARLLTDCTGIKPDLVESPPQQPRIANLDVHCSVSHSGNAVMAGFSTQAPIGVDIEQHRQRDFERLVMTYFHPEEKRRFTELDEKAKQSWFYRVWTRKEARGKTSGRGLTLDQLACPAPGDGETDCIETYSLGEYTASVVHQCSEQIITGIIPKWDNSINQWIPLQPSHRDTATES